MVKNNWFPTLVDTLVSEKLLHTWNGITMPSIEYGETRSYTFDDGSKYGHYVTIYRSDTGMYERPIHYPRG
jgi:hypothetical protein